jgi:tetratricopeptide (TPR) repeat protein
LQIAEHIEDETERTNTLKAIARALTGKEYSVLLNPVIEKLIDLLEKLPEGVLKSHTLIPFARVLLKQQGLEEGIKMARSIEQTNWSSIALSVLSSDIHKLGNFELASKLIHEAYEKALDSDLRNKVWAIFQISIELNKQRQFEKANIFKNEALDLIRNLRKGLQ